MNLTSQKMLMISHSDPGRVVYFEMVVKRWFQAFYTFGAPISKDNQLGHRFCAQLAKVYISHTYPVSMASLSDELSAS